MRRIVSCYSNSFGPAGVRAAVEGLASLGVGYVELALRPHDFGGLVIPESAVITENTDESTVDEFVEELHHVFGIEVSACNVGGGDLRTPEGYQTTVRRMRFASRAFGARLAISGAGQPTNPGERATVIEHLRKLGDVATGLGMDLSLETHKGPTQNADAMLALMAEVDHPRVRLNFDTGNIAYYNPGADPVEELDRVKHLVRSVHLKDNRGGFEEWYFPAIGDGGAVDFRRVKETLDGVGFAGPYTIEIEGIGGEDEPGLEARRERVARSVRHLRSCGYFE
jgi:L-ribulose-5-phosphate 3-epimerase